ncbi:SpoIIE family protein phosphatase [Streptomyces zaomyceticus]|uniref:SpoIIE family protein phosphatase n=1 Tax=Streptomyces zaomyceticus TaxID=68286 RepID=UPI00344849D5
MFLLQLAAVVVLVAGVMITFVLSAGHDSERDSGDRALSVAQGFAASPGIAAALASPRPTETMQSSVERAARDAQLDFVGVTNRSGTYEAHSLPDRIGSATPTDLTPVLAGNTVREQAEGPAGPQIQASAPVKDPNGTVIGAVTAGIALSHVEDRVTEQLPIVLGLFVGVVTVMTGGAALVSRRLLRQTHGLGPVEITRMYEHHDAVLHSVKEGVLIVGPDARLLLANDEARRLLSLTPGAEGRSVDALGLPLRTAELLASGRVATDEVHPVGDRTLAVNQQPTNRHGGPDGSVTTLRDTTELEALTGKVEASRKRWKVLYEASVSIGTSLDVTRTAEELAEAAVPDFADLVTVDLAEPVFRGEEPTRWEQELRRAATAGVGESPPPGLGPGQAAPAPSAAQLHALAGGRGILEADLRTASRRHVRDPGHPESVRQNAGDGFRSLVIAPLSARGTVLGIARFWRTERHGPFEPDDLALAEEVAVQAAVCIDNARRYTREHTVAETLQRSLLPGGLPEQNALEVAHRYLSAHARVGGDWFDVIKLSGARVALVVGDVVGHGVHAAATMGRLRTAVHHFSALDLPPGELLAQLDELVARIDADEAPHDGSAGITGATCLYAVYDPVTGDCALARAGHPPPVVLPPDGTAFLPDVPVSPPLGTGANLPYETVKLSLPVASRLVLFTDGLIGNRHRDLDAGLDLLRTTLAGRPHRTPEQTCQDVLDAMLPGRPGDDIALLVARTERLDPAHVAEWDVPHDFAAVATVRRECARRLAEWDLEEISFATELILSELITNAIRYGTQPVRVRLLKDLTLICEISDASSTSPHMRRATDTDEGGRGLFLVAQYAEHWGTRYLPRGKVIWASQSLRGAAVEPTAAQVDALLDQWDE